MNEIFAAAAEAQQILAENAGAPSGGVNSTYRNQQICGTYGNPYTVEVMQLGGGSKRRVQTSVRVTRTQLAAAPQSEEKWLRTDMSPPIDYRIKDVDANDPIFYFLTLVRFGQ